LKINHRNSNKNKSDKLSQYDVSYLNVWIAGYRGNHKDWNFYTKKSKSIEVPRKSRYRFSVTNVAGGICLDCKQKRCPVCNGCPVDIFDKIQETAHCQRCICYTNEEQEPLNNTGVSLEELVRKRQGVGFKNYNNGNLKK
jgi:hypothetical protein